MRILQLLTTPNALHGTELCAHASAAGLVERGHEVYLAHDETGPVTQAKRYAALLSCPELFERTSVPGTAVGRRRRASLSLKTFAKDHDIDVIHAHSWSASILTAAFRVVPTVVTVHMPMCPNGARFLWRHQRPCGRKPGLVCLTRGYMRDGCGRLADGTTLRPDSFFRMWAEDRRARHCLKRSAAVVAVSSYIRQRLIADGLPAGLVTQVPNAVMESDRPTEDVQRLPDETKPIVLFVGRMQVFKGVYDLLSASQKIETPHALWYMGNGSEHDPMKRKVAKDPGLSHVAVLGGGSRAEVAAALRRATVVAFPSRWPEAFGRVGVEAARYQRPVVAYNVGGVSDWLIEGQTGYMVSPGDVETLGHRIEALLQDHALAQQMGKEARRMAFRWTRQRHAQALEPVLQSALGAKDVPALATGVSPAVS